MRAYDPSIAAALAFHSEDHLTAVNFRTKRGPRRQGFDRLTPSMAVRTTDARVFYVPLC